MQHAALSNGQNKRVIEIDKRLAELENGSELQNAYKAAAKGRRPKNGQIVKLPLNGAWGELLALSQERVALVIEDKIVHGQDFGL